METPLPILSPDALFQLAVEPNGGEFLIVLQLTEAHRRADPTAKADWHGHSELQPEWVEGGARAGLQACLDRIVSGAWVIAGSRSAGEGWIYEITDDVAAEAEIARTVPERVAATRYRTWSGRIVHP